MPQTSPMNWMMVSLTFLLLSNMILMTKMVSMKLNMINNHKTMKKNKKWLW